MLGSGREGAIDGGRGGEGGIGGWWGFRHGGRAHGRDDAAEHPALVVFAQLLGLRVVVGGGEAPILGLGIEAGQELDGIDGVGRRVESVFQGREGGGVEHQVHLHAADVDRHLALCLQGLHGGDGVLLRVEEAADAIDVDGPGPGADPAHHRVEPAAFHAGDGGQQGFRYDLGAGGGDRGVT